MKKFLAALPTTKAFYAVLAMLCIIISGYAEHFQGDVMKSVDFMTWACFILLWGQYFIEE